MSGIDASRDFISVRIAVLTVSDTRGPGDDRSGDALSSGFWGPDMYSRRGGWCGMSGR